MRAYFLFALTIFVATLSPSFAETVYKCQVGEKTIYSQEPCANPNTKAKTLEINDARSPEQREQSQAAVQAQATAAEALESKRVATETQLAKQLADQQAAAARAARTAKASEPVVVQPIIVVRPATRTVTHNTTPAAPQKPYCHLSALRCN